MIDKRIWRDQQEFNDLVRQQEEQGMRPISDPQRVKEFTLHLMTELAEFLEAAKVFGAHRRPNVTPLVNGENVRRQLIDIQKYWISLCQELGYTPEQMEQAYWRKSATVRQRFAEEWITQLNGPVALLDLDGVLCDFYAGIFHAVNFSSELGVSADRLADIQARRKYIDNESLGITLQQWNALNHEFRSEGGFRHLPPMPKARDFLRWCQHKYHIVVMTSRPIDEYPNLYDDTVAWFQEQGIVCDRIWWGPNKAEKLASVQKLLPDIAFAIDDDPRYVEQFVKAGVGRVFWYKQSYHDQSIMGAITVSGLNEVQEEMSTL